MAASGLHISISAEKVFSIAGLNVSNSMLTSLLVSGLLITVAVLVKMSLKKTDRPTGLQNFAEWLVESLQSMAMGVTGSAEKTRIFFPWFATFLLFIMLNNWLGLFPGVGTIGFTESEDTVETSLLPSSVSVDSPTAFAVTAETQTDDDHGAATLDVENPAVSPTVTNPEAAAEHEAAEAEGEHQAVFVPYFRAGTADLNTTLALAIISVVMTQVFGFKFLKIPYFSKFINFSSPIGFFLGLLETVLEFAKIISFAFRLFGNIFAGEVLLAVIYFLVPLILPMPFLGLEVVVGVIQALVFSMLSLVFFNMATIGHHEEQ